MKHKLVQRLVLGILALNLIISCASKEVKPIPAEKPDYSVRGQINAADIVTGHGVVDSGWFLMNRANGLWKIVNDSTIVPENIVVVIHGYKSEGTEWVDAVKRLSQRYGSIYFYRWDWNMCPQEASTILSASLNALTKTLNAGDRLTIFSHSYAGVIALHSASQLSFKIPTEIHLIAASLLGHPRLEALCIEGQNNFIYTDWSSNIQIKQWKTIKAQDGAFRDLEVDPQNLDNAKIEVFYLPESMDGHRLGHNWSVLWVVDRYLGYPHDF